MTNFKIDRLGFTQDAVRAWAPEDRRNTNWPVVYVLDGPANEATSVRGSRVEDVYVGESLNAAARMRQHLESDAKQHLSTIRVVIDETFNKSACLDLESYLIRLLAGDGRYQVLNRNVGITDAAYYNRDAYQETFREVFEQLSRDGVFSRSIPQIENSDLFKLSPFKALSQDQAVAVEDILDGLFADLATDTTSTIVIQGNPGTGKTVVAIYLLKLLVDIKESRPDDEIDNDTLFSDFFVAENRDLLTQVRVGFVIPQQSLRESVKKVFAKTPGLNPSMVMSPFDVGLAEGEFDLLIVDEAHRLNQRANQSSGDQNKKFKEIGEKLFDGDDVTKTQLDWITAKSKHQIFLLDSEQSVRPADVPVEQLNELVNSAKSAHRHYPLLSQMRVSAGSDYVAYVRRILGAPDASGAVLPVGREDFDGYDLRLFDDVEEMHNEIRLRDAHSGLARMIAGFAWEWKSKKNKAAFDIDIDGYRLRWNRVQVDWIASAGSLDEVGSIHTVQGYDLNYAGVIIGPDLRFDESAGRLYVDRKEYRDKKGKENNRVLGRKYTDDDLLRYVRNIYAVLLTRSILGTYVYVADPALREYLKNYLPIHPSTKTESYPRHVRP